jgi:glycosyltransferase involved in cell wall biosynthesis
MNPQKILVFAEDRAGGIKTFWDNVPQGDAHVDFLKYRKGSETAFDPKARLLTLNLFDPLIHVYRILQQGFSLTGYDVLVTNQTLDTAYLAWVAPEVPICFIVHGNHGDSYDPAIEYRETIDHCFCVSEAGEAYLRPRMPGPVESFAYATFIPAEPAPQKKRKVVFVGRFAEDKNIRETLGLFRFLKTRGWEVRMMGEGGMEAEVRQALAPEEVRVGPVREEIYREMADASFLCLNSYIEGLPVVYSEAMHFRMGVILNYMDKSIHGVVGENYLLMEDSEKLIRKMESFTFRDPPAPRRVNHPELNREFLKKIRNVRRNGIPRKSVPPKRALDRIPWPSGILVRTLRAQRWKAREQ